MDIKAYMQSVGIAARQASRDLARASSDSKNNALISIAKQLDANRSAVLAANKADMDNGRNNGLNHYRIIVALPFLLSIKMQISMRIILSPWWEAVIGLNCVQVDTSCHLIYRCRDYIQLKMPLPPPPVLLHLALD